MDGEPNAAMDALPGKGQPSPGEGESPSEKTYTEKEAHELADKKHSKLDSEVSGLTKERDALQESLATAQASIDENQRRIDETEEEGARGKPELLDLLAQRKALRTEKAQIEADRNALEQERRDHAEALTLASATRHEIKVWDVAKAHGIDAITLKDACAKFKLVTDEQVEEMAEVLSGKKPVKGKEGGDTKISSKAILKGDSGGSGGGGEKTQDELLKEIYPTMYPK